MAKTPQEVFRKKPTVVSEPAPELVTLIVDALETAVDSALESQRSDTTVVELVLEVSSEYCPLTPAVFDEFKRRYQKTDTNPGWSTVEIRQTDDMVLVRLVA